MISRKFFLLAMAAVSGLVAVLVRQPEAAAFATAEVVAGREDRHWCPRCIKGGRLKGAA